MINFVANTLTLPDRIAWLAERRNGLGASDVAAALGINPWKSTFALWAEKCGLLPDEDLAAEIERVEWGLRLEPNVIDAFGEKTGRPIKRLPPHSMCLHSDLPWLRASLDAIQNRPDRDDEGDLQAKTTDGFNAADWRDGAVPIYYQVQVQAELAVTGMQWGSIAVLIGGNRFRWLDFDRDDKFIDAMLPHLERFWQLVETKTPPEVDGCESTAKAIAKLHPDDNGQTVELPEEALGWHQSLLAAKAEIKRQEELEQLYKNKLIAAIGPATYGQLPNGENYSYKSQSRAEHVVRASTFRVLRKLKG